MTRSPVSTQFLCIQPVDAARMARGERCILATGTAPQSGESVMELPS